MRSAFEIREVWGLHVGLGTELQVRCPAVLIEVEIHPLALSQHAKQRPFERVGSKVDVGQIGLVDQHAVTGSGVVALDHTLHRNTSGVRA